MSEEPQEKLIKDGRETIEILQARSRMRDYAERWIGTLYKWGGDDPTGLDCSGFVIEVLKSEGLFTGDTTANGLMNKYREVVPGNEKVCDMAFWTTSAGRAYHVGLILAGNRVIEASGGDSGTRTEEDAAIDNAYIKIRSLNNDKPDVICTPFFERN